MTISEKNLIRAIKKERKMDIKSRECVCNEIFIEQPNLLTSVLVQQKLGNSIEDVEVLLNILIVLHLAVKESGKRIVKISEEELEHQFKILSALIRFTEGMKSKLVESSIDLYIEGHGEKILLAYVFAAMKDARFFENTNESSKCLIMAGINSVNCIANAQIAN